MFACCRRPRNNRASIFHFLHIITSSSSSSDCFLETLREWQSASWSDSCFYPVSVQRDQTPLRSFLLTSPLRDVLCPPLINPSLPHPYLHRCFVITLLRITDLSIVYRDPPPPLLIADLSTDQLLMSSNNPASLIGEPASTSRQQQDRKAARSDNCRCFKRSKSEKVLPSANRLCFPAEGFSTLLASPSPSMEASVSITTFNILAPIYKRMGNEGCRESQYHDAWFKRNVDIIDMLLMEGSSIICLQEFWLGNEELVHLYEESLGCAGYDTFRLARTSDRGDGLLTAIKNDRISVLNCKDLRFNDCGDRVAQFFHLRVKVPFFKRNQIAEQQLLLVNTHLLFPHDSSFCLVRLWQVYKIIECLEHFKVEHGLASVPVILCGDWNGSKRGHVFKFLRSLGFVSCYDSAHSYNDNDAHRWVSHRNHRGNICGVDFIWLRNPNNNYQSLSTSWREAVLGIIMAKLCDAGISGKDIFGCIQQKGICSKLSLYDLQKRLHQLGVTGRWAESLISEEIQDVMQSFYVNANDLIDRSAELEVVLPKAACISKKSMHSSNSLMESKEITRETIPSAEASNASVRSESAPGLTIQGASLFPPQAEQGLWPEDYVLSDHAPLTATFRPKRLCG